MISVLVYRLFFSGGRHKTLYVLVMAVYYILVFTFVSNSVSRLTDSESDADVSSRQVARKAVLERWEKRAQLLKRYCRQRRARPPQREAVSDSLISRRLQLSSCASADTPDRFWLRTFTRLAEDEPGLLGRPDHSGVPDCEAKARRLGALRRSDPGQLEPGWRHVVTVQHPFLRLAAAFVAQPYVAGLRTRWTDNWWTTNSSTFGQAVDVVTSGGMPMPAHAAPLTSVCDLCRHKFLTLVEMGDEELGELGDQLDIADYLRHPPRSRVDDQLTRRLVSQLTDDQVRRLARLYRHDFSALPQYRPTAVGRSLATPSDIRVAGHTTL